MTPLTNQIIAPNLLSDIVPSEAITPLSRGGATDFMEEIWKEVIGWENSFMVSSIGRVKAIYKNRPNTNNCSSWKHREDKIRKTRLTPHGYISANLYDKGKQERPKIIFVHVLVAQAFIPNPQNKRCVNHINGIKTDNRVENLEWVTHGENVSHSWRTKLSDITKISGEKNWCAKLNDDSVRFIKANIDKYTLQELGTMFNVSLHAIFNIKSGRGWKHIK